MRKVLNHENFKPILTLLIIYVGVAIFSGSYNVSDYFIDIGRELYIPTQILRGQILYKDILNIFGPLSYQINAVIFLVFGENLEALRMFSFINGFFVVLLAFFISRYYNNTKISWLYALMICLLYVLGFNTYITPYSYAIVYATTGLLACFYLLLKYVDSKNNLFLYMAFLAFGVPISCKYEYVFVIAVLLLVAIVIKKLSWYQWLFCMLLLSLIPTISFGFLFWQGLRFYDLTTFFIFLKGYATSESLQNLYRIIATPYPTPISLAYNAVSFLIFGLYFLCIYTLVTLISGHKESVSVKYQAKYILELTYTICIFIFAIILNLTTYNSMFSFTPLICLGLLGYKAIRFKKELLEEPRFKFAILLLTSILASLKGLFYIPLFPYGAFLTPLALLGVLTYTIKRFKNSNIIFYGLLCLTVGIFVFNQFRVGINYTVPTETNRGSFRVLLRAYPVYKDLIPYINNNVPENQKLLVIPEGQFINFITQRPTDNVLSTMFMPPYIEGAGEDTILKQLEVADIKYILQIKRTVREYTDEPLAEGKYFGQSYAFKLNKYIQENYQTITKFGPDDDAVFMVKKN